MDTLPRKDKPLKLAQVPLDGDEIKSAAPGNDINIQFKEGKKNNPQTKQHNKKPHAQIKQQTALCGVKKWFW